MVFDTKSTQVLPPSLFPLFLSLNYLRFITVFVVLGHYSLCVSTKTIDNFSRSHSKKLDVQRQTFWTAESPGSESIIIVRKTSRAQQDSNVPIV